MIVRIQNFIGEIPAIIDRNLPDNAAAYAVNLMFDDTGITPMKKPILEFEIEGDTSLIRSIYKHDGDWITWNHYVNVARGAVDLNRLYITGDGVPKLRVDGVTYPLAIPYPTTALTATLTHNGNGSVEYSIVYVYTNVTDFGEETEPSPISNQVIWTSGGEITLSGFQVPTGTRVTKQRIYRSQTGQGGTDLFFVAERAATTSDYVDIVNLDTIGEPLPSLYYNAPPDELRGIVSMPNGIMAGFVNNDIYFCEPYIHHAYPENYIMTVDYDIVGLAAIGNSLAIMTKGNLYMATGSSPDAMILEKLELNLPCIAAQGIQDMGYSVVYPTHDGLVSISTSGTRLITDGLYTKQEWLQVLRFALLDPDTLISGQANGEYLLGFNKVNENGELERETLSFKLDGSQNYVTRYDIKSNCFFYGIEESKLFYVESDGIRSISYESGQYQTFEWLSKEFVLPKPTNFGAFLIESNRVPVDNIYIDTLNNEIVVWNNKVLTEGLGGELNSQTFASEEVGGDFTQPLYESTNVFVNVEIITDRKVEYRTLEMNKVYRLSNGFLSKKWQIRIKGFAPLDAVFLANNPVELSGV